MRHVSTLLALLCVGGLGSRCCAEQASQAEPAKPAAQEEIKALVEGNNAFSVDLYSRLAGEQGNLFFSPQSIHAALAMTYAGAAGQTARQMADVLRLPTEKFAGQQEPLHGAFGGMLRALSLPPGSKNQLVAANALWGQKDYAFAKSFLDLLRTCYGAGLEQVDFKAATEDARQAINAWVEKQTRDKIKDLIARGVLTRDTRLVLTNAIYFKGIWASQFKPQATRDEPFRLGGGKTVNAPMMHQTGEFDYMETDTLMALRMPYADNELSMIILLPVLGDESTDVPRRNEGRARKPAALRDPAEALADLEKQLSAKDVSAWLGKLRPQEVQLAVPRFKLTCQFQLADTLKAMGMKDAFDPGAADLSGMTGRKELFISAVVHKAYVDVNEEGTEAAAATGVVVAVTAVRIPKTFRADHPFVYLIRHEKTGAVLFMGRVTNPKG